MAIFFTATVMITWSFAAWLLACNGFPAWPGYAVGLFLVSLRSNLRAVNEARKLPNPKDLQ